MAYDVEGDPRIDPRVKALLAMLPRQKSPVMSLVEKRC